MLYKNSKKVLNAIVYLCNDANTTSSLDIVVYFNNKTNDLDLYSTLDYLCDNNYITIGTKDGCLYDDIATTHLGRHYKEIRLEMLKEFLFKSVCVPIAVSLITSLLYNLLIK